MKKRGGAKPRVRVVWDEENLDYLEASKTPKQKITEPKTPYYAADPVDGVVSPTPDQAKVPMEAAMHAEAIRHALCEVASSSKASTSRQRGGGWASSEDEGDDMEHSDEGTENGRSWSFEEHRRNHYDEFRKAKGLGGHSDGEEEDDSGGREGESRNAGCTSSSASRSKMGSLSGSSDSVSSSRTLDPDSTLSHEIGNLELQDKPFVVTI